MHLIKAYCRDTEYTVTIDDCVYNLIKDKKINIRVCGRVRKIPYPTFYDKETKKSIYLHRYILEIRNGCLIPRGYEVDHINGDTLDCRFLNLRIITHNENCNNRRFANHNNRSVGVLGISRPSHCKLFRARLKVKGEDVLDKYFKYRTDAITARREAEQKYIKIGE